MVAGWDDLVPGWFTRLHARYKTPVNSIVLVGASALAFGLLGIARDGHQQGWTSCFERLAELLAALARDAVA